MKIVLKYVGMIVALSIIGFLMHRYFMSLSLSQLDKTNHSITSAPISRAFMSRITFALSMGALPMFYFVADRLVKLKFVYKGLITCLIIVVMGILGWQLRVFQINSHLRKMATFDIGDGIYLDFNFQDLKLAPYLFMGFAIGTALSVLIFRNKNKIIAV